MSLRVVVNLVKNLRVFSFCVFVRFNVRVSVCLCANCKNINKDWGRWFEWNSKSKYSLHLWAGGRWPAHQDQVEVVVSWKIRKCVSCWFLYIQWSSALRRLVVRRSRITCVNEVPCIFPILPFCKPRQVFRLVLVPEHYHSYHTFVILKLLITTIATISNPKM